MDPVTRRDVLMGGGTLLGLLAIGGLSGCQNNLNANLPDPVNPPAGGPLTAAPTPFRPLPMPNRPPVQSPVVPQGVIARSQWTRMGVARPSEINPMNGISRITIHHDGMNAFTSQQRDDAARRLEQVRMSHAAVRGWADIGYHYIIDPAGRVWEGRNIRYQGAHVKDQNEHNLGIMCMGNYNLQKPTSLMLATLDSFVASQMRQYGVSMANVRTHRERAPTECPGNAMQAYINQTRARGGRMAISYAEGTSVSLPVT